MPDITTRRSVVVVGAGAFGGWTALHLLRLGANVTLIDAWGAGNARASSGGETRVIRAVYDGDPDYIAWTARSFVLWREAEHEWQQRLFVPTGALWMFAGDDSYARKSIAPMREAGLALEESTDYAVRYPQMNFAGVRSVYFEPGAGYLLARRACQTVRDAFVAAGGDYRELRAEPGPMTRGSMEHLIVSSGPAIEADAFVFACGPWLGRMFPEAIGDRIIPTRQEVFFFGTPAGDHRFTEPWLPVWIDFRDRFVYAVPGNDGRGFKVADDTRGPAFDPTDGDRIATKEGLARARSALALRLPAMAEAPLLETRVCQYEQSPDGHFIIDTHPAATNVWLVGGGSGHGFKLAPALGEHVARLVSGFEPMKERFRLQRFE